MATVQSAANPEVPVPQTVVITPVCALIICGEISIPNAAMNVVLRSLFIIGYFRSKNVYAQIYTNLLKDTRNSLTEY